MSNSRICDTCSSKHLCKYKDEVSDLTKRLNSMLEIGLQEPKIDMTINCQYYTKPIEQIRGGM